MAAQGFLGLLEAEDVIFVQCESTFRSKFVAISQFGFECPSLVVVPLLDRTTDVFCCL